MNTGIGQHGLGQVSNLGGDGVIPGSCQHVWVQDLLQGANMSL